MTPKFEYYKRESDRVSSAAITDNERIRNFNAEKRLKELNEKRGKLSLLAYEKAA